MCRIKKNIRETELALHVSLAKLRDNIEINWPFWITCKVCWPILCVIHNIRNVNNLWQKKNYFRLTKMANSWKNRVKFIVRWEFESIMELKFYESTFSLVYSDFNRGNTIQQSLFQVHVRLRWKWSSWQKWFWGKY